MDCESPSSTTSCNPPPFAHADHPSHPLPSSGTSQNQQQTRRMQSRLVSRQQITSSVLVLPLIPPPPLLLDRKSKAVSDKIKRRLSLRYASSPPPPVPSLPTNRPSAPQGAIARRRPSILDSAGLWGARDELDVPASVLKEEDELVGGSLDLVGGGGMRKDPGTLDISLINQEGFDPQACMCLLFIERKRTYSTRYAGFVDIKTKLAGASPEDIGAFAAALEANKAATAKDVSTHCLSIWGHRESDSNLSPSTASTERVQKVSNKHPFPSCILYSSADLDGLLSYAEFITISKEIATLENDMLELKELLSEWKGVPEALGNIEDPESQGRSLSLLSFLINQTNDLPSAF